MMSQAALAESVSPDSILLIEDDPISREAVSCGLTAAGYRVVAANDCGEALSNARDELFSVVLTDLHLPDAEAGEAIQRLDELMPTATFVVITSDRAPELRVPREVRHKVCSIVSREDPSDIEAAIRGALTTRARLMGDSRRPVRILLLEDERSQAFICQAHLAESETLDAKIQWAHRCSSAEVMLQSEEFDVILCDLSLPDAQGLDAVRRVHAVAPTTPIVVVSELSPLFFQAEALELGAQDHLTKDQASTASLSAAITKALARKERDEELRRRALFDPLTGVANRCLLLDRLGHCLRRRRDPSESCALVYLDLDGFKEINDTWGHGAGDIVLVNVSQRLTSSLREVDTVARLGGDEFVLLLEEAGDRTALECVMRRVFRELDQPIQYGPESFHVTASAGVVLFGAQCLDDPNRLLSAADRAMYLAKGRGKHRWCFGEAPSSRSSAPPPSFAPVSVRCGAGLGDGIALDGDTPAPILVDGGARVTS